MTKAAGKAARRDQTITSIKVLAERDWAGGKGDPIHFVLLERLVDRRPSWQNLTLKATGQLKKHRWDFGWNGSRLSNTDDRALLAQHYPEIYDWVLAKLRAQED